MNDLKRKGRKVVLAQRAESEDVSNRAFFEDKGLEDGEGGGDEDGEEGDEGGDLEGELLAGVEVVEFAEEGGADAEEKVDDGQGLEGLEAEEDEDKVFA